MSLKSVLTLNKVWMTFIHHYHVNYMKMRTAKKLYALQYSGAEWCTTSFLHTQCTLCWNQRPLQLQQFAVIWKLLFLHQLKHFSVKKARKNNINKLSTYFTISQIKLHVILINMIIYSDKNGKILFLIAVVKWRNTMNGYHLSRTRNANLT